MIRAGVHAILATATARLDYIIDEADTTEAAIQKAALTHYDVILMDFQLPAIGGDKATRIILDKDPTTPVLAVSTFGERVHVHCMLEAGASGYVLKNVEPDTLVTAIKTVIAGKKFYSNEVSLLLLEQHRFQPIEDPLERLTSRERELFRLTLSGLGTEELAARMGIGPRTVDKHRQHLKAKLGVRRTLDLYPLGQKLGLLH
jgi:DNA-binding NarL/FixJ family response regulator